MSALCRHAVAHWRRRYTGKFQPCIVRHYLLLLIVVALALVYRLAPMNRGLGQDELFTTVQFIEVPSIFRTIFFNMAFNNHIGYSVMARTSEALFGRSEWALRLPALLLGVASLYALFLLGRVAVGRTLALSATLLLALSPAHIVWSVEARGYSALIFFTLLSSYFYLKLLNRPTRRDVFLYVTASVLGIYVHLYATLVVAIQILLWLPMVLSMDRKQKAVLLPNRETVRALGLAFLAIGGLSLLLYVPVLRVMLSDVTGRGRSDLNPTFPLEVIQELAGSGAPWVVAAMAVVSALGWFSLRRLQPRVANYFALLLIGPLMLMWLARPFDLYPRFFAYWLPYFLLFFVTGLGVLAQSISRGQARAVGYASAFLAAISLSAVLLNWTVEWQNQIPNEGYREVSEAAMQDADPAASFCAIGGARSVWHYYIDKPIATPLTVAQLRALGNAHREVRCVYYEASWQDRDQTDIARFLFQHASWSRVNDLTWFVYKSGEPAGE
jgi:mannosyltransferase